MRRFLAIWEGLSPQTREQILQHWPWVVAVAAGAALACYLGLCRCACGQ